MKKMENLGLVKKAKTLNVLLIIWTIVMFVFFWASNFMMDVNILFILLIINILVSTTLMVCSIVCFIKMRQNKIPGDVTTLISGILIFVFSITQLMLGIVVFILSGISIRKLREYIEDNGPLN